MECNHKWRFIGKENKKERWYTDNIYWCEKCGALEISPKDHATGEWPLVEFPSLWEKEEE